MRPVEACEPLLSGRVGLEPAFDVRSALGGSHLDLAKRLGAGVVQLAPALPELEHALAAASTFVFALDAQALLALIEQVRDGALTSVDFEYRVGWPDASHWTWRRLQVKVVAHDAQTGRPLHLAGTSTDIGERKRAEMRLRDREERLRLSELRYRLAAASGQLWDWDVASGRFNVAPESWRRLGFEAPPPGEEIARYAALIHPDDLPLQRAALREHLARRTPYAMEFRARDSAGHWRRFHTQGKAIWDEAGRATYMAGTTVEIETG